MNTELARMGGRLRELRKEQKMTLQELAKKTGLSAGLLSKIENFRAVPSLPVLLAIAAALEADIGAIFAPAAAPPPRRRWLVIRREDAGTVDREESSGFEYKLILESKLSGDRLQVMLVAVQPGARREKVTGEGVELLYLLSGEVRYHLDDEYVDLRAGDTLFFDSRLPHLPENRADAPAVMLVHYFLDEPIFQQEN